MTSLAQLVSSIRWFEDIGIQDIPLVGGKNASLGEMYRELASKGVKVPNGFAVTAEASCVRLLEQCANRVRESRAILQV